MKKHWMGAAVLAVALLLLGGCGNKDEGKETAEEGVPVEVQTVQRGSISTENKLSGTVVSGKTEQVYVSVSARCSNVYVEAGDTVKKGQTLCTLDLTTFHDNYALAEQNYNNAKQNYADQSKLLDDQIAQLEKNYQNSLSLLEIGAASQAEVDAAKMSLDSAKIGKNTSLSQLDLAIKTAQNSMKQISDTLNNVSGGGSVTSPFNGTVASISVGKDGYVSAGMPIAAIESSDDIKVALSVSENLIAKLNVGDKAAVSISALGQSYEGSIVDISKTVNPQTRLYTVNVSVPKDLAGLLSGMFADVSLFTDSRDNTVVIPTEALLTQDNGQCVVLLNEDKTSKRVVVQTGLIGEGVTEVLSGLNGGETLVTVGQSYLKEGDLARVVSAQE